MGAASCGAGKSKRRNIINTTTTTTTSFVEKVIRNYMKLYEVLHVIAVSRTCYNMIQCMHVQNIAKLVLNAAPMCMYQCK